MHTARMWPKCDSSITKRPVVVVVDIVHRAKVNSPLALHCPRAPSLSEWRQGCNTNRISQTFPPTKTQKIGVVPRTQVSHFTRGSARPVRMLVARRRGDWSRRLRVRGTFSGGIILGASPARHRRQIDKPDPGRPLRPGRRRLVVQNQPSGLDHGRHGPCVSRWGAGLDKGSLTVFSARPTPHVRPFHSPVASSRVRRPFDAAAWCHRQRSTASHSTGLMSRVRVHLPTSLLNPLFTAIPTGGNA